MEMKISNKPRFDHFFQSTYIISPNFVNFVTKMFIYGNNVGLRMHVQS